MIAIATQSIAQPVQIVYECKVLFSDQCPSFRYLCVIIVVAFLDLYVILVSCGHVGVICAVGIMLGLLLLSVMMMNAATMMTMIMLMAKMTAAMVVMRVAEELMMMAMMVLSDLFGIAYSRGHSWLDELLTGWFFLWLASKYKKNS